MQNNIFKVFDPQGLKLLNRLRLAVSHVNEHRFRHNFQECMNPVCSCSLETEDISHYPLNCNHFTLHCIGLIDLKKHLQ